MEYDEDVLLQQEKVRRSGRTNMFDRQNVQRIAHEMDFHALVTFIEEHSGGEYIKMANESAAEFRDQDEL